MSLFNCLDIDKYLLTFLKTKSLKNLSKVDKYYNEIVKKYSILKKYYDFYCSKPLTKTISDVIKYNDVDIYKSFRHNYKNEDDIRIMVQYNSINIIRYMSNLYSDYINPIIISESLRNDNVYVFEKYCFSKKKLIKDCIEYDAVNIFTKYYVLETYNFTYVIISNEACKIFEKHVIINDIINDIVIEYIFKCDALKLFLLIDFNKYEHIILSKITEYYPKKIIKYLYKNNFINNNRYEIIFTKLMTEQLYDTDVDSDDYVGGADRIDGCDHYKYLNKMINIAINIKININKLDLKNIILQSVINNNYAVIRYIYFNGDFDYIKFGFPKHDFDNDILFMTARKLKHKWITYMLLFYE